MSPVSTHTWKAGLFYLETSSEAKRNKYELTGIVLCNSSGKRPPNGRFINYPPPHTHKMGNAPLKCFYTMRHVKSGDKQQVRKK